MSCRSRLVSDARRRYAARKGRFSRPRPLRERMKRKSRHGSPPGNAPRRNIATTCHSGTHRGGMLPRQGVPGICGRDMLPLPVRATLARCRDEGAGGARGNHRPLRREWGICVALAHGAHAAVFSGSGGTAQLARCRVRLGALIAGAWSPFQRPHGRGVGVPFQRLNARSGFESALFRWATMGPFRVLRSSAVSCAEAKCALTFMLGAANVVKGMSWAFARQWEIWQAR